MHVKCHLFSLKRCFPSTFSARFISNEVMDWNMGHHVVDHDHPHMCKNSPTGFKIRKTNTYHASEPHWTFLLFMICHYTSPQTLVLLFLPFSLFQPQWIWPAFPAQEWKLYSAFPLSLLDCLCTFFSEREANWSFCACCVCCFLYIHTHTQQPA